MAVKPENLDQLLAAAGAALGTVDQNELLTVTVMCWLGPGRQFPHAALRQEVLDLARRFGIVDRSRVLELVTAYGCGWKRSGLVRNGKEWDGEWIGAYTAMVSIIKKFVFGTHRALEARVIGYPKQSNAGNSNGWDAARDAGYLFAVLVRGASSLPFDNNDVLAIICTEDDSRVEANGKQYQRPVPPGAKAVFSYTSGNQGMLTRGTKALPLLRGTRIVITSQDFETRVTVHPPGWISGAGSAPFVKLGVGDIAEIRSPAALEDWGCTCGWHLCEQRHRLAAWDPQTVNLDNFIASAVKGTDPSFRQVGAIQHGMLAALLAWEGF